jgi:hypothetical protein
MTRETSARNTALFAFVAGAAAGALGAEPAQVPDEIARMPVE